MSESDKIRAEFWAWVQEQGCDTDGAWSAWQGCWNRRHAWTQASERLPLCDGETVFIGINTAGYSACFNQIRPDGVCEMKSPEDVVELMSCLEWWRELGRPGPRVEASLDAPETK